jgi:hypothetical protein
MRHQISRDVPVLVVALFVGNRRDGDETGS